MTDLPAIPASAAPRPAPSAAARTQDTSSEIQQSQHDDGQFHEELSREMNALQDHASSSGDAKPEPADRGKGKDAADATAESVAGVDGPLAAMLAGAALPAAAKLPALGGEAALGDAAATNSAADSAIGAGLAAASGTARGAHRKAPEAAGAGTLSAAADSAQNGREHAAAAASTEFALAANAALAESAAGGKILPAVRDALGPATGLDTARGQRPAAETPAAGMNTVFAAPSQAAQAATATIAAQVAAPGWDRGLGEKVVWMAGQHLKVAELHLNPPELGPLQITLTVNNDQASAQFVSQHAAVRDAIEAAMPRLREMLAEGGISLGNTSVSADAFQQQAQAQQDTRNYASRSAAQADADGAFRLTQPLRATRGLVDIFA